MAITNHERVGKALQLLKAGLAPFCAREVRTAIASGSLKQETIRPLLADPLIANKNSIEEWDVSALLKLMWETWNEVFRRTLGPAERSLVAEVRDWRNKWAHQQPFSSDDAYRALDSIARLLTAISAGESEEVERAKMELLRVRFDEQLRGEKRKAGGSLIEAASTGHLKPWREIVTPHPDVASGRYQQAEFAADLWQVHLGHGTPEYRDPVEFFRRTYLTASLKQLLVNAIERLTTGGGDPVVQLQTNFGGGKTHSMLALYHLFSGVSPAALPGIDAVLAEAGVSSLPKTRRVVLVGNKISPGNPATKPDGTVVRTLWGELAWQLGGREAYAKIADDDLRATNPGDRLRELFEAYSPCLILIDEWVAYARQLHDVADLPGGSFETQFSFAQALTESAKLARNCLLVISLPASDSAGSAQAVANDIEVGGWRGREALERLRNVVGRVESSWRPASAEEGFEIVRRRLFEPLVNAEAFKQRDLTARAFAELYRTYAGEFPLECRSPDYEKRIQAAFPIHPEVFDRLYGDWSSLAKFQRTRGVLRLMAAVIHSLWENGDKNPLILPSTIPIDDRRVQFELTRYLPDNWVPVIEKDVDGPNALPLAIDREVSNLGKFAATRRVARTIYLGSAPLAQAAHRGLEDRRVKLGCVMPGEPPAVFGDALRRLAATATYLYQDGSRYWYSTQPTVTKLAEDRAEQYKRDPDKIMRELERRLRTDLKKSDGFARIHVLPQGGADVSDECETRLVVLGPEHPHGKEPGSDAERQAQAILEMRGNTPRRFRNTLVFLAVDRARWAALEEAIRRFLAWESILAEREALNLDPHQVKQAETQKQAADAMVNLRLGEAYQWLLVPYQEAASATIGWEAIRLSGSDPLAVRAAKKLRYEERLIDKLGAKRLRIEMDRVPLWRGEHVEVKQLSEDFASYLYLPRLAGPQVLFDALREGVALLTWREEGFAYADAWDAAQGRYLGLRGGEQVTVMADGLVVKPEVASRHLLAKQAHEDRRGGKDAGVEPPADRLTPPPTSKPSSSRSMRFHGSVPLSNPLRVGLDVARIADQVIAHLAALPRAELRLRLEIEARLPAGVSELDIRVITEKCSALKFDAFGFEPE